MADTVTPSILNTVKKMLGLMELDTSFDVDIIANINTAFMTLHQLGVGPATIFSIVDSAATWASFFGTAVNIDGVKTYMYLKVRLAFDPPSSGILVDAISKQIAELEFRLNVQAEPRLPIPVVPEEV